MKLIRREPDSDALADWLDSQTPAAWVSSTLIEVELPAMTVSSRPQPQPV